MIVEPICPFHRRPLEEKYIIKQNKISTYRIMSCPECGFYDAMHTLDGGEM